MEDAYILAKKGSVWNGTKLRAIWDIFTLLFTQENTS